MELLFRGEYINDGKIEDYINKLEETLVDDLANNDLSLRETIDALAALGKKLLADDGFLMPELRDTGLTEEEAKEAKQGAAAILDREALYKKVKRELFETPFELAKRNPKDGQLEGWMSLGVLGHVTSSNDAVLPFLSAVEGLLSGNINVVKTARGSSGVAIAMAKELCAICPKLSAYMYIFPISSKQKELLGALFACCDGIAVWGSEGAVAGVRELAAPGTRIIDWGHRISFAYVTKAGNTPDALRAIARDIAANEQQACSAPQVVYYETESRDELAGFAHAMFDALSDISPRYPLHAMSAEERAELTSQTELAKLGEIMGDKLCLDGGDFRVFVEYDSALSSSPLFRTIIVKPMARGNIIGALRPFRSYLQTAGLACAAGELCGLTTRLMRAGVTRVTSPGKMMEGYDGEPHDGVYALSRYVKRVSMENGAMPSGIMEMGELERNEKAPFEPGTPIMHKADFKVEDQGSGEGKLIIKSGGSSGKAVYAPHTYSDAQMTYQTTARAMIAAGLDPKEDVCMNLFYCGDMYGGFISMYEALKLADITQLPMAASMDMDFVLDEIEHNGATALIGMPTYLIKLFREQRERLKKYGKIKKIFYGGEHFDPQQIDEIKRDFGVSHIGSLVYGCNEIGAIGYTCPYCTGSEHHLLSSKYMEILKIDSDEPAAPGETGRIVLTPVDQEHTSVRRYEIGDLGRFVDEPCGCGRLARRFELLGRFGDIFKFATNYLNAARIKRIFTEALNYTGWLQIRLDYDGTSKMTILTENDIPGALDVLTEQYPEIAESVHDKTGEVICRAAARDEFLLSTGGGKVRLVVDNRK